MSVIPLDMTPYTMLYADLVKQKAKDVAEAKQIQTKMREVISVILDATVKEPRQPGDDTELFSYLTSMTAKKIRMQEKLFVNLKNRSVRKAAELALLLGKRPTELLQLNIEPTIALHLDHAILTEYLEHRKQDRKLGDDEKVDAMKQMREEVKKRLGKK